MAIDKLYVTIAFLWLIASAAFGTWLGAAAQLNFAQSHAHVGLLGFMASAIFGLIHRAWPQLRTSRLAVPQLVVYQLATATLLTGKVMIDATGRENGLLMVGAPAVIVGVAMFLWIYLRASAPGIAPSAAPAE